MIWFLFFFFFKQKTAYEMRISDWSSDVCSSDLSAALGEVADLLGALREGVLVGVVQREPAVDPEVDVALGDGLVERRVVQRGDLADLVAELHEELLVDLGRPPAGVPGGARHVDRGALAGPVLLRLGRQRQVRKRGV